jgi:surface protein
VAAYSFYECTYLEKIVFTSQFEASSLYDKIFENCASLKSIVFEPRTSPLYFSGNYMFNYCSTLEKIDLSSFEISLRKQYTFQNCRSLRYVKLLDCNGWSSIKQGTFNSCKNLTLIDLSLCTGVISLSSTTEFNNSPNCKIVVPDALYDNWIAATNWSTSIIASKIIKKSDWDAQNA